MTLTTLDSPAPLLDFTPEVAESTAAVRERLKNVIPDIEWPVHAPYIDAINKLKKERNAVVLAHNYQTPEIFYGIGDITGDSLALAQDAVGVDADLIIMCGVHFMAETAKLLNPNKTVIIPDPRAGCSLATSITPADIRLLRERYPNTPVVTYVNTTAEIKAETDICCTSANAVEVVESLGVDQVIFLPDRYLANYVATKTKVKIIAWHGCCEVHERFTAKEIATLRENYPGIQVLAHPECPPDVIAASDFTGSTAGLAKYVGQHQPDRVVLITECSMSDNVAVQYPNIQFVRPCNLCPHMKRITLPKVLRSLQTLETKVEIPADILERARLPIDRMLLVGRGERIGPID